MSENKGAYTKKVINHFRNPQNYGKMKNPDGIGKVGNLACGDIMWLYIRVAKNKKGKEVIKDIKFETFGCVAALATSSAVTGLAKGKTINEAIKIKKEKIIGSLGGLPNVKIHCSVLASDALIEAIYDYLSKNDRKVPKIVEEKHKRVKKEREIIEKKYKDWVKTEESMIAKSKK